MGGLQDKLVTLGTALSNNKYLGSIKDAFQKFMPFTMIGAIAVLWSNVIVNENTGLGALWQPIMNLKFLNPLFNAINFCTIGCMALIMAYLIGGEIAKRNDGVDEAFGGGIAVAAYISTLMTSQTIGETTVSGLFSDYLGANGLFTAMIVAIVTVEIFAMLYKVDALRIKLPDSVPPQISNSFAVMIPAAITLVIIGTICLVLNLTTGLYLSEVVLNLVQRPLMNVGGSLPGMLLFQVVILSLWTIGLHGDNMVGGIVTPLVTAMTVENMNNVAAGIAPTNIFTSGFNRAFFATGGTGMVLGLTLAILLRAKREENRSVAKIALVPNLFNISEINMFGLPVVLTPALMIPFIITPLVTGTFGYIMTQIGFCPIFAYEVPWTMPPLLISFVATGGSIRAVITQLLAIIISVLIYLPFISVHEKAQAKAQGEVE